MLMHASAKTQFRMGFLWMICLVAAMGGLLFGYDWVVIGGAKPFYESYFDISDSPFMQGLAMSAALFGCLIGAAASGMLTDRYGRKWLLVLSGFLFTASAIGTALAPDFITFNVARLIGGIGIGLASNLSPMYIAEISPAHMRGRFVSINQLTVVIGILAAQIVNWLIARDVPADATLSTLIPVWYGQVGWRWMFGAESIPAAAFFLMMFFVPESPRWLAKAGRFDEAEKTLRRVGGDDYARAEVGQHSRNARQRRDRPSSFPRFLAPGVARDSGARHRARRAAAMVRHQRDFQLRAGGLCGRRLQHQRHHADDRAHRHRQSGVHVRRHLHRRPIGPPHAHAHRLCRPGIDLRRASARPTMRRAAAFTWWF